MLEVVAVAAAEMRRQHVVPRLGELEPARIDAAIGEPHRRRLRRHDARGAVIEPRPQLAERLRPLEVPLQFADAERPAGMGQPGPFLEVDRVERPRPAAPMVGAAAQIAHARGIQRQIGDAAVGAGIERLRGAVEIQAAALEQHHADGRMGERQSERDAGRPAADDRQIRLLKGARGHRPCVDEGVQVSDVRTFRQAGVATLGISHRPVLSELSSGRKANPIALCFQPVTMDIATCGGIAPPRTIRLAHTVNA